MTRLRTRLARALVLGLLLLTLGGGIANADGNGSGPLLGSATTQSSFPDDPGFTP